MEKGDINSLAFWVHSSFAAASLTFFFALLSAAPETQRAESIAIASFFMVVSLVLNTSISFVMLWFKRAERFSLTFLEKIKALARVAIGSFLIGLGAFITFYSWCLLVVLCLSGSITCWIIYNAIHKGFDEGFDIMNEVISTMTEEEKTKLWE